MPRLSTLSNPTGLIDIEKQRLSIVLDDEDKRLAFSLTRLDLSGLDLSPLLDVVVIARRGNAEERVELGGVATWDRGFHTLTEIGRDGTWMFRVLLVNSGSAKLVAAAENIRPEGQGDSEGFFALEPADLGQRPWEVEIKELEGRAVIRFSKDIYHSAGEAEADRFFTGFVLPEAVRQLAAWVASSEGVLEDTQWESFRNWLTVHGITQDPDPDNPDQQAMWTNEVVHAFCDRFEFVNELSAIRSKGIEE